MLCEKCKIREANVFYTEIETETRKMNIICVHNVLRIWTNIPVCLIRTSVFQSCFREYWEMYLRMMKIKTTDR